MPVPRVRNLAVTRDGRRAVVISQPDPWTAGSYPSLDAYVVDLASNQVQRTVRRIGFLRDDGGTPVAIVEPPLPPAQLTAQVVNRRVVLSWVRLEWSPIATDYQLEAGLTPGSFGLLAHRTGSGEMRAEFTNVPPGEYYVRVRGINAAGVGNPSAHVHVAVP